MQLQILKIPNFFKQFFEVISCFASDSIHPTSKRQVFQVDQVHHASQDMVVSIISKIFSTHSDFQILQLLQLFNGVSDVLSSLVLYIVEIKVQRKYLQSFQAFHEQGNGFNSTTLQIVEIGVKFEGLDILKSFQIFSYIHCRVSLQFIPTGYYLYLQKFFRLQSGDIRGKVLKSLQAQLAVRQIQRKVFDMATYWVQKQIRESVISQFNHHKAYLQCSQVFKFRYTFSYDFTYFLSCSSRTKNQMQLFDCRWLNYAQDFSNTFIANFTRIKVNGEN